MFTAKPFCSTNLFNQILCVDVNIDEVELGNVVEDELL